MLPQITTLINHKDKPKKSERTLAAIHRVGQAVGVAVGRFVAVGEAIAAENQELKDEMGQACFEARRAGESRRKHGGVLKRACRQDLSLEVAGLRRQAGRQASPPGGAVESKSHLAV